LFWKQTLPSITGNSVALWEVVSADGPALFELLADPAWQSHVIAEAQRLDAGLVILEPLRSLTTNVDQGRRELQPFARFARRLVAEVHCCLLFVHHDTKPQAGVTDTRHASTGRGIGAARRATGDR
jgi:RecA-family ATPase